MGSTGWKLSAKPVCLARKCSDAVGVTIIEEADLGKIHQDFFDAAQAKPLSQALLVEYDGFVSQSTR